MSIIFGGDTGIREDAFGGFIRGITDTFTGFTNDIKSVANNLLGKEFPIHVPKENVYVDDGFANVPGTAFTGSANISSIDDVKKRRITTQAPDATIYVKKRVFWSLRNEHDSKFMGSAEKLFMRASKLLFERKCSQIAAYEAMTKLEKFAAEDVEFDVSRIGALINLVESFKNSVTDLDAQASADFNSDLDFIYRNPSDFPTEADRNTAINTLQSNRLQDQKRIDKLKLGIKNFDSTIKALEDLQSEARLGRNAIHTTWVVDTRQNTNRENTGRGTGVIELTLVDSLQTNLSLNSGDKGSFNFTVQDPYNLLSIRREDIEMAVASAFAEVGNSSSNLGPSQILQEAREVEERLRVARNDRFGFLNSNSSPLSGANNVEIIFEVNPSSLANDKVVGRVSSLSEPFTRNTYNLVFLQLPLIEQLTPIERSLVKSVFDKLHEYVDAVNNISVSSLATNPALIKDATYTRRQMRMHYLGKPIVQPMDGIHIYIRGNTVGDDELIGPLSFFLNDSPFIKGFAGGKTTDGLNDAMLEEEMMQFGISKDISIDLYRSIRSSSMLRNAGIHVFGGLVSSVSESYNASRGSYVLSVSGESNMKWLDLSRVNVTPSLDQAQGVLEDPLTPLEIEIDDATGLIKGSPLSDENKKRIDSGLFYKDGVRAGEKVTDANMKQDVKEFGNTAEIVRKHSPGLIYRWKKYIVAATRNVNLRTSLRGSSSQANTLRRDVGVTVLKDSFANLDVADVISLLVTGQPHNYESFLQNASSVGSYVAGNANSPESFFNSISDITRSTNRALGGFEPMKFINIDRAQMAARLNKQTEFRTDNKKLQRLQSQIASFIDDINLLKSGNNQQIENKSLSQLKELKAQLRDMSNKFQESIKGASDEGLRVYGNDILIDTDMDSSEVKRKSNAAKTRTRFLQMRPQIATKLNTDKNLFIVSDDYDKDLDLQAFVTELASGEIPIWNSTYKNPKDICVNAANVIDFEFFCDTAGHLRLQPPKYNKLPLSLLAKMLLLSDEDSSGVSVLPPFVKSLFESRAAGLGQSITILQNEIKILSLLLFGQETPPGVDLKNQGDAAQLFEKNLVDKRTAALAPTDISNRIEEILKLRNEIAGLSGGISVSKTPEDIDKIKKEVDSLNDPSAPNVNSARLAKINRMLKFSGDLQRATSTKNKIDIRQENLTVSLKNVKSGSGTQITSGDLAGLLQPFGDLIEDDFNDFLGPGSSNRFIIKDDQIISYDFKESDANVFCRADVTGQVDLTGEGPGSIGGIPMIWAGATDFDLWKQYGYRPMPSTNKPFFKDAEVQCAPYAMMLLTRQRKDTVRANITLVGNEFYQLGDVVYINSRDMLYYVTSVSHTFSFTGGGFTTKLDLRYGHPLGEFIPTPLDVIGKNLIKNEREFNTTFVNRNTVVPSSGRHAGVVSFISDVAKTVEKNKRIMLTGDMGISNLAELKNALMRINVHINSKLFDRVEVRGFVKKIESRDLEEDKTLVLSRMEAVRDWLLRPLSGYSSSDAEIVIDSITNPLLKGIPKSDIRVLDRENDPAVLEIDKDTGRLKEANIGRTPSEETYNVLIDPNTLLQNVVEIVLVFK